VRSGLSASCGRGHADTCRGRATIAAGALPSDAASIRAWLADPQRYKPGAFMPRVPLSDADLDALASYLVSLR